MKYEVYEQDGRWFVREVYESGWAHRMCSTFHGRYKAVKLAKWFAKRTGGVWCVCE